MKKLIASILIGVFCLTSGAGLAAATVLAGPHHHHHVKHHVKHHGKHHDSFWVKYGKWIVIAGVLWWIIDDSRRNHPNTPPAAPAPEMLPGDRALHNVYGDNIPQVK